LLNFEAVDYEATVYVNGAEVGFNRGGYSRFTLDITANIVPNGVNQL
jgi:beta-galactosidase/beta-glucuronidase